MSDFIKLSVRVTRPDPKKPDRQITDFEDSIINLDHIQFVSIGLTEDTCVITFPGNVRQMAKATLEELEEKLKAIKIKVVEND